MRGTVSRPAAAAAANVICRCDKVLVRVHYAASSFLLVCFFSSCQHGGCFENFFFLPVPSLFAFNLENRSTEKKKDCTDGEKSNAQWMLLTPLTPQRETHRQTACVRNFQWNGEQFAWSIAKESNAIPFRHPSLSETLKEKKREGNKQVFLYI